MLENRENPLSSDSELKVTNLKTKASSSLMSSSLKVGKICFPVAAKSRSLLDEKNVIDKVSFLSDHRPEIHF